MNEQVATEAPAARARAKATRRPAAGSAGRADAPTAKSKDDRKRKVSFYLDARTAEKLAVGAILRGIDQSDLANEIISRAVSSVTYHAPASFHDRATRPTGEPLTVNEIGGESAGS